MDDLLHSLGTPGQGSTRAHPLAAATKASEKDGAAFGLAFGATLQRESDQRGLLPLSEIEGLTKVDPISDDGTRESKDPQSLPRLDGETPQSAEGAVPDIAVYETALPKLPSGTDAISARSQLSPMPSFAGFPTTSSQASQPMTGPSLPSLPTIPTPAGSPIPKAAHEGQVKPMVLPAPQTGSGHQTQGRSSQELQRTTVSLIPPAVTSTTSGAGQTAPPAPANRTPPSRAAGVPASLATIHASSGGQTGPLHTVAQKTSPLLPLDTRQTQPPGTQAGHSLTDASVGGSALQKASFRVDMSTASSTANADLAPHDGLSDAPRDREADRPARYATVIETPVRPGAWQSVPSPTPTPDASFASPSPSASTMTVAVSSPQDAGLLPLDGLDLGLQTTALTSASITALGTSLPPQAAPAHAYAVAQQIARVLAEPGRDPGGMVELALDPPELGRLRMQMVDVAGILTLTIMAERPETADLMRRHLELLANEFSQAGLDAPNVEISHGETGPDGQSAQDDTAGGKTAEAADLPDISPHSIVLSPTADGTLDLRL